MIILNNRKNKKVVHKHLSLGFKNYFPRTKIIKKIFTLL